MPVSCQLVLGERVRDSDDAAQHPSGCGSNVSVCRGSSAHALPFVSYSSLLTPQQMADERHWIVPALLSAADFQMHYSHVHSCGL